MPKFLTDSQCKQYEEQGFAFPLPVLADTEREEILNKIDSLEAAHPDLWSKSKIKPHLLMKWLNDLMRHPRILDAVEDVLGPNILAWATGHFDKKPFDSAFVSWHQDGVYWGLSEPNVVSAWIALTPSNKQNGCLRVVPGTHKTGQQPHIDTFGENNMLSRGQDIAVQVDESKAVDIELAPGEMSLHHTMLVHGSEANRSEQRRLGIVVRYVATHVKQLSSHKDSATLVRGVDHHHNFLLEPKPACDFDPVAQEFYDQIVAEIRQRKAQIASANQTEK